MSNPLRNGESPDPLRAYEEADLITPPFKLPESLVNDIEAWAGAYSEIPGDFAAEVLRIGLRIKMYPSDAVVHGGPKGPISVQKLGTNSPIRDADGSRHPI